MFDQISSEMVIGFVIALSIYFAWELYKLKKRKYYANLRKAFAEDFPNSWGEKPVAPKKRPRLYKQAVVVTKGELPKPAKKVVKKMPLKKSTSKAAFQSNVKAEVKAGKKPAQAVAIAYSVKREATKKAKVK